MPIQGPTVDGREAAFLARQARIAIRRQLIACGEAGWLDGRMTGRPGPDATVLRRKARLARGRAANHALQRAPPQQLLAALTSSCWPP